MPTASYIHGTSQTEQARLAALNRLTNPPFMEFLKVSSSDIVLEVGSGLGILISEVALRVPRGKAVGLECSSEQLARARAVCSNAQFYQGDAHALPFQPRSFDVVYCRYLLEHVAEPLRVLKEMHRVLKPGGRACVQENNILIHVLYPECARFDSVWRKFASVQERLGGDSLIGKKLFPLLKQASFRDVSLSLAPEIHHAGQESFHVWIENLMGNVAGAADQMVQLGLSSRAEINEALEELDQFRERDDGSAIFYWNRAAGKK